MSRVFLHKEVDFTILSNIFIVMQRDVRLVQG